MCAIDIDIDIDVDIDIDRDIDIDIDIDLDIDTDTDTDIDTDIDTDVDVSYKCAQGLLVLTLRLRHARKGENIHKEAYICGQSDLCAPEYMYV